MIGDTVRRSLTPTAAAVILGVAALVLSAQAHAMVIGFEGVVPPGSLLVWPATPYSEGGFTITNSLGRDSYTDAIYSAATPGVIGNGTDIFGWAGTMENQITLSLTQDGGAPFSIESLDASPLVGGYFHPDGMTLTTIGYVSGGGTVTETLALVKDTWVTFGLPATFGNLTRLDIIGNPHVPTGYGLGNDFAMDNLVLNQPSQPDLVPEPATLSVLALGALGLLRRRRNR